jgi:hypothetical protein
MAIVHITNPADLRAGDKAVFAPFGVPFFENNKTELEERDGLVGIRHNDDKFFPVVTPEGEMITNLTLVDATRDVFFTENPENVGKEVNTAADLPDTWGVRIIVRHPKHGDYRGFASNDNIDGYETIRLLENMGHGSFGFWKSSGYTIHLLHGLDYEYKF